MKKYILFFLLLSCGPEESRLADSYYQNKNYNKAIEYYTESLKLKPCPWITHQMTQKILILKKAS